MDSQRQIEILKSVQSVQRFSLDSNEFSKYKFYWVEKI